MLVHKLLCSGIVGLLLASNAFAQSSLTELKHELAQRAREAQTVEQRMLSLHERQQQLQDDITTLRANAALKENEAQQLLQALVRLRKAPPHSVMAHETNPHTQARASIILAHVLTRYNDVIDSLQEQAAELAAMEKELNQQEKNLNHTQADLAKKRHELEKLISERERQQPPPLPSANALAKATDDVAKKVGSVEAVITETEKQQAAIPLPPAARPAPKTNVDKSFQQFVDATNPHQEKFTQGALVTPVVGRLISRYGQRNNLGHVTRGLSWRTTSQAAVISPFSGSVIFAGAFRGYGTMIIIRHQDGYHSVLAGLEATNARVGEWLVSGEPVGTMPKQATPELYYELRRQGNPVNPLPWLAKTPKNNAS